VPDAEPPPADYAYKSRTLGRNISAERGRQQLSQTAVAARMRERGFRDWHQQTVASVEKGTRRLTVEEVFGLALALESTVPALLTPHSGREDPWIELPSGSERYLPSLTVINLVNGKNDGTISWYGNKSAEAIAGPPERMAKLFERPEADEGSEPE
jgi:transcriptional regulator with XRE-family HTH domain